MKVIIITDKGEKESIFENVKSLGVDGAIYVQICQFHQGFCTKNYIPHSEITRIIKEGESD